LTRLVRSTLPLTLKPTLSEATLGPEHLRVDDDIEEV